MTKLIEHLRTSGLSQEAFAQRVGITQGSLSKICKGTISPSLETALAIERETSGAITLESWPAFKLLAGRVNIASSETATHGGAK